jgi:iron complex outermembrane recepter protein
MNPFKFTLTGRGVSSGTYDNSYVECASNCPASTVENITVNSNRIDGQFVMDTSISFSFEAAGTDGELQFTVLNLFNQDPALAARGPTGNSAPSFAQTNPSYYDFLGRRFLTTFRIKY